VAAVYRLFLLIRSVCASYYIIRNENNRPTY
jgi:hypothetical protein